MCGFGLVVKAWIQTQKEDMADIKVNMKEIHDMLRFRPGWIITGLAALVVGLMTYLVTR